MDIKEVQETLRDADKYLHLLNQLTTELDYAAQQIELTGKETERNIHKTFDQILQSVTCALTTRRDELILETSKIRQWGLSPLVECKEVLLTKIQSTTKFIGFSNELLCSSNVNKNFLDEFTSKSSLLGSLPEVPQIKEVPHLSFQLDFNCENELVNICRNIGSVIRIAPVQIHAVRERPGALLVKWTATENDDRMSNIQEYHLEKAYGNIIAEKHLTENFRTCYIGTDQQYLVKDITLHQDYTFRVCCKFEGETKWSPWSLCEVGSTTLQSFCWSQNQNFALTNENKVATPLNNQPAILFSKKADFNVDYSVEFTFLECDSDLSNTYVGLFAMNTILEGKTPESECICVETNGNIYGSGSKKSTQFPPITKGSKICFTCEMKEESKLRINIDSCGRRVTYDWPVTDEFIYFGARFNSPKWKIMID